MLTSFLAVELNGQAVGVALRVRQPARRHREPFSASAVQVSREVALYAMLSD